MNSKICGKCKVIMSLENFNYFFEKGRNKWRYSSYCKECQKENKKKHYTSNKEKYNILNKKWILENSDRHKKNVMNRRERVKVLLPDFYVIRLMTARKISEEFIMSTPEAIETRRLQVKINRKLKELKNGKKQIK